MSIVAQAVKDPIRGLQIIESGSPVGTLQWASWGIRDSDADQHVVLALLSRSSAGRSPLWSVTREDGYDPTIREVYGWTYGDKPILALQYQLGAADAKIELYGLDKDGTPHLLDTREAASVSLNTAKGGDPILVLYDAKPTILVPHCATWNIVTHRLLATVCGF